MVPLASLAVLIAVGIGVDFTGQTTAEQGLRDQAMYCARLGAAGANLTVTATTTAIATAEKCLVNLHATGTVTRTDTSLIVTVTGTYPTKLLTVIGVDHLPLAGTAAAAINPGR